jgi:fatty acid desaturase
MERFSVARGHLLGLLCFAVGFSIQSLQLLVSAHRRGYLSRKEHLLAIGESLLGVAVWVSLAVWLGPVGFLFAYVIPLLLANTLVMAYILTNHNLNPLNDVNDPLLNSLTVTVPPFFDALHSKFGLHVEHHLFPAMSSEYLPRVREELQQRWPERYQSTTLVDALGRLLRTPRIYRTATVLHDPRDGFECETLLPRKMVEQVS